MPVPQQYPGKPQRKVQNFLINPAYQFRYIFWVTLSGLAILFMNAAVFYKYTRENYDAFFELVPMTDEAKNQLFMELNEIMVKLGLFSLFFLVFVCLIGVVVSHRTAGPMYHFKRVFNDIKMGKLEARVRLRPTDDFQDVAKAFNEMMDQVSSAKH